MTEVIYYIAVSADGYIAAIDGGVEWMTAFEEATEDYGYALFYAKVEAASDRHVRAHMVLAGSRLEWDWDWAAAEREFQEVLRINPKHIETLNWYSGLKMCLGQFDEQFALVQKAYSLNPLDLVTLIHLYRYYPPNTSVPPQSGGS